MPDGPTEAQGDAALLRAALAAAATVGITDPRDRTGTRPTARGFARHVLGVGERTVRRWLAGEAPLPDVERAACQAIVQRPALARALAQLHARDPQLSLLARLLRATGVPHVLAG